MNRFFRNQKGGTLIIVLIVLVVFTILGGSLLAISLSDTKMVNYQENSMKAYFLAQSAAYTLADYIIKNPDADVSAMISADPTLPASIGDGSFMLDVSKPENEIIIKATGNVKGVEHEVSVALDVYGGHAFEYTLGSKGKITLSNHVEVKGKVATNSSNASDIQQANHSSISEDVIYNANIEFPPIVLPQSFTHEFSNRIENDLSINVYGETYIHFKEGVSLSNHKTISINGNGTLHLYVKKGWVGNNHSQLQADENITVFIYILDDSNVTINSSYFEGIIYAPYSAVSVENASGNNRCIYGSVIAREIRIDGNHTVIEYNPNIDFNNIQVNKTYKIKEWK